MAAVYGNSDPPIKNQAFSVQVCLQDMANPGSFLAAPTLAAGKFKASGASNGGSPSAMGALATTPVVDPAGSIWVNITLSATEMNFDQVFVQCIDTASPKAWADYAFCVNTCAATRAADVQTIKTNPVVNGGTVTFPTNATLASTTNVTAASGVSLAASQHVIVDSGTVTTVTNQLTAAAVATGVWQDATAGDFTVASSIGKSLFTSGVVPGANGGLFIAGTNAATTITTGLTTTFTDNLTGSAASVTGAVGSVTGAVGSVAGNVGGNVGGNVAGSVASVTAAVTLSAGDSPVVASGTAAAGAATTITIQTALGTTADVVGCKIKITGGTGANQTRVVTGYVNGTKVVTVNYAWTTNPDATSVYSILFDDAPKLDSSLKVSGVVLADTLTTYTGNTPQTGDAFAVVKSGGTGDAAAIKAKTDNLPAAPASTTNITSASGVSLAASQHVIVDSGTVTTLTNLPAVTANWLTAAGIDAAALDGKGDWSLATTALSNVQWTNTLATNLGTLAGHDPGATLGTSTLTQTQVTGGAYSVQSASCALGDARIAHLNADVDSRMATYAQPTGFLAATFPADPAGLAGLASAHGSGSWATAAGFATPTDVTNAAAAVEAYGNLHWLTAAGFSTLTQAQVTGGAYSVQSALCVLGDARVAHLDADVTSRTKPADTQAAVTLVATTTDLTNAPAAGDLTAAMKASVQAACDAAVTANALVLEIEADTDTLTAGVTVSDKTGFALAAGGLDAVLVESGIVAGAGLVNDSGSQLTSVNARQALALAAAALEGVLSGAATTTITLRPVGNPSAPARVVATVDADDNRTALTLRVPD